MFGQTSTWGQNNQQQQQQQPAQQTGGLFGSSGGGFGQQNTGFGQPTSTFGQPAQTQPQGGLFGGGAATGGSSFGGFGQNNQQQQQASTAFGARPAFGATGTSTFGSTGSTGGGLFGASNNTTSTFGSNTGTSGGLFGAKPATTSGFGAGTTSTLFGAKPANTTPFGASSTNAGGSSATSTNQYTPGPYPPPPGTGTADPIYFPTWQQDPAAPAGPPHLFHVITAMNPYKGASWEELRLLDYQQNRKEAGAQQQQSGFGQPAAGGFGQPAQTNTFGQPAGQANTFGQPKPGGLFGSTGTTGGFGTGTSTFGQGSTSTTGGGLFGQPQQQPGASNPFGASTSAPATGGLFGQPAQPQQPQTGGGLFGSSTTPFGAAQPAPGQAATSSFGGFGQAKPAFGAGTTGGFGQPAAAGTSTFGQPAGQTGTGSTFSFGASQPQQTQQPGQTGGLFGGGGFGANTQQNSGTSLFGQPNQQPQQNQPATGGLFGSTAPKPGGLFGSSTTGTGTTGSFGGFGQTNTQQPAATGSLFGAAPAQPATGTSLFGQPQQNQQQSQPAQTGSLFGGGATGGSSLFGAKPATGTTGGLFGATQPAQQPAQTGTSLFGSGQQTGGGLFGSTNNALGQQTQQQNQAKPTGSLFGGGGLFGQQNQQPQQQQTGGGPFGSLGQSQPASTGMFGSTAQQPQQQSALGGSLFAGGLGGSTMNQQQQPQPTLTASLDQNPYGNNALFQYNGQKLDFSTASTKKPALPPLTSSSFRVTPSSKSQLNKLRGFASPLVAPQSPARSSSPLNGLSSPGRLASPAATDRYKGLTDSGITPNAFVPRPSIKKLTVTPKSAGSIGGSGNMEDKLESVLGKSALRSSGKTAASPAQNGNAASPGTLLFNPPQSRQVENGNTDSPLRRTATPLESSTRVSGMEKQPKKGEYWCKPNLSKLKQLTSTDLRELHHFSAGRRGFGEVTFLEPVDLTGVDLSTFLGQVVVFSEMELAVYPDDYPDKPPRGQGLNVPAQITLENCFTKDKATKQPIKDVNDPRHVKFLKRVKNIPDTEFVSWTEDGCWTFRVEHFSRYGLNGEEESDEEASEGGSKVEEGISVIEEEVEEESEEAEDEDEDFVPPSKSRYDKEEHDSGLDEEDMNDEDASDDVPSEEHYDDLDEDEADDARSGLGSAEWDQAIKTRLGTEGMRKLREMQAGFFGEKQRTAEVKLGRHQPAGKRALAMMEDGGIYGEKGGMTLGARRDFREAEGGDMSLDNRAVKRTSFGEPSSPPKLRQPRKYARVALAESVVKGVEGVRSDAGLALGRSFRCSWGPNGQLVHFGRVCKPSTDFTPSSGASITIQQIPLLAQDAAAENRKAIRLLRLHLAHSTIENVDGIPQAFINDTVRFGDFAHTFDAGDRSHEANIFRLGVALFDEINLNLPVDASDDLVARISEIRRKLALGRWLEDAVRPAVDSDLLAAGEDQPAKVFTLLSGNQIERAVQAALDGKDMRLATLLAQIGGADAFREEIRKQLSDWEKYKANAHISVGYRRLYALLAGITGVSKGAAGRGSDGCPDVFVSKGLDWKRAFGLQLWFGNPFEDTIGDALDSFTSALSSPHPPAKPLPPYLEKPSQQATTWTMPAEPTDVLFSLIRLYSDLTISLDKVLPLRDASASPLDARIPWHLYMLLSRVLAKRDFADREVLEDEGVEWSAKADGLTQSLAAQLEVSGEWSWAAFVMLHLETAQGREKALKALLHRHPAPTQAEREFLVETLKVPFEWLHEARAAQLCSENRPLEEYHALISAGMYDRAHEVLKRKLAPEAVIRDDRALLRKLCEKLDGAKPDGWEYGGKLFLDYVNLLETTEPLLYSVVSSGSHPDAAEAAELATLAQTLQRALQLVPALFPDRQDVQQVAGLSDMLSGLHDLAGKLTLAGYMQRPPVTPLLVDVDRLHFLQASAYESFERSLASVEA